MKNLVRLISMYVQENNVLHHTACRWPLFFAFFLMVTLFVSAASAFGSDNLNPVLVFTPDTNEGVTATHREHEMKVSVRRCETPDCETKTDCEPTCTVSGSCTHSVFVESTMLLLTDAPTGKRPFSVFNKLPCISREPNSVFRPPRY